MKKQIVHFLLLMPSDVCLSTCSEKLDREQAGDDGVENGVAYSAYRIYRVIHKTLDSPLEIYSLEGVYHVKQIFMILERGAN